MFWYGLYFGFVLGFIAADLAWRYINRLRERIEALQKENDYIDAYLNRLRRIEQ